MSKVSIVYKQLTTVIMDSFTYYFDVKFLPEQFDSYFSNQIGTEKINKPIVNLLPIKENTKKVKYTPTIMEESSLEFKRTKYNNRSQSKQSKKRKHK